VKITKLVHSCLLVEIDERVILIDPGQWSWESGLVDLSALTHLDLMVITHEHADHFHPALIHAVVEKFPRVRIVANEAVANRIKAAAIKTKVLASDPLIQPFTAPHEALPAGEAPLNTGFHIAGRLTIPGDSLSFDESKPILALPYVAPWGSLKQAVDLAVKVKPKYIVPIHDAFLSEAGQAWHYSLLKNILAEHEIEVFEAQNAKMFEIKI